MFIFKIKNLLEMYSRFFNCTGTMPIKKPIIHHTFKKQSMMIPCKYTNMNIKPIIRLNQQSLLLQNIFKKNYHNKSTEIRQKHEPDEGSDNFSFDNDINKNQNQFKIQNRTSKILEYLKTVNYDYNVPNYHRYIIDLSGVFGSAYGIINEICLSNNGTIIPVFVNGMIGLGFGLLLGCLYEVVIFVGVAVFIISLYNKNDKKK